MDKKDLNEYSGPTPSTREYTRIHNLNPAQRERKHITDLINRGFSHETKLSKGLSGSPRARGFKAIKPGSSAVKFAKTTLGGARSATVRLPKGRIKENYERVKKICENLNIDVNNFITEVEMNQVDKLLNKSKEIKQREQEKFEVPTDYEVAKTMTGNSANTNIIEINPKVAVSSRLTNLQ